ncbi:uroporphyrinogen-III C-methyltransferase [Dietzia cinnamea]|uniref:uroporphyrinogen-III C-methyltransferase n=1 Tax=Dietzia cinnamea TaxID=321318 RepID=UPI000D6121B6|nr:uroporphyrinogen-III C-methyltransferase [Dietzia cinnamea]PWD95113.1 uroporphyrinogen-III C-methyltransferase [Dietzia maris]MBM7229924.1 uroporphyrinogen-III C-methyltransferase [Dietzia cinnamea]MCT1639309.1 uroporphyrinogen-III C-methyltransferase [Dietzia cinnamea]MCT2061897.1 uroporphyrinogen-III C-methyltransferase [Dietzia cinnamea]MCT2175352.1 uroporphyrinogen-III C-methyltransferase [Dietzia cinnamea]
MIRPVNPYPVGLDLEGRRVVVIGGGSVAQRRVPVLLEAGAVVHLISPDVTPTLQGLIDAGRVWWEPREYRTGDLEGAWYAVAATRNSLVNARVAAEAEQYRTFCVRSDAVTSGTAVTPAVVRRGQMLVSVLTGDRDRTAEARDVVAKALDEAGAEAPEVDESLRGTVALVGGGPGADDLMTVRGRRLLARADVVVADRLAPQRPLAELRADVEIVDAAKIPYGRAMAQDAINEVLVDRARAGKFVVRLKGGDPFLYGRGFEEAQACAEAGIPCTVVPGVSSALAVPALAGIPVTNRGMTHELTVVSGHLPPGHPGSLIDWEALARMRGTLVVLMGVKNSPAIAGSLMAGGRSPETPAAVVVDGSLEGQSTYRCSLGTLAATLSEHEVRPPAIVVIGDVAGLPQVLAAD